MKPALTIRMSTTIREATQADLPALVQLCAHFLDAMPHGQILRTDPARLALLGTALIGGVGTIWLAEHEEAGIVGILALAVVEHPASGQRVAEELIWWVEPTRRKGLTGPRLVNMASEWACGKGCAVLKMGAPSGDVAAYYSRLGFQQIETVWMKELR